jgi:acyl-coenzyme A thioesterase PaaI-like protein
MVDPSIPAGFEPVDVGSGYSATLGQIYLNRARPGLGLRIGAEQCNPVGGCHGGALATFADAQIIAIMEGSERRSEHHPTISLAIDYIAGACNGDWLESETVLDRQTRTLLFIRSLISANGNVVARCNAIYRYMPRRTVPSFESKHIEEAEL